VRCSRRRAGISVIFVDEHFLVAQEPSDGVSTTARTKDERKLGCCVVNTVGALLGLITMSLVGLAVGGRWFEARATRRVRAYLDMLSFIAALEAKRRQHAIVTSIHLAYALLAVPDVARAMQIQGVSVRELRAALDGRLTEIGVAMDAPMPEGGPGMTSDVSRPVAEAVRRRSSSSEAAIMTSLVRTLVLDRQTLVSAILSSHGVDAGRFVVKSATAPPATAPVESRAYRALPAAGASRVVLWNDDVSKMEGIVAVLEEVFGMERTEAGFVMMLVHWRGQATVCTCGEVEAASLAELATAAARARGMPTRITVEPARPVPASWRFRWFRRRELV
jgi:ATP-dependent Clp protease adaptor protein ClpS